MRSALEGVDGVSVTEVSMPGKAVITIGEGVKSDDVIAAVKKAGFGASVK